MSLGTVDENTNHIRLTDTDQESVIDYNALNYIQTINRKNICAYCRVCFSCSSDIGILFLICVAWIIYVSYLTIGIILLIDTKHKIDACSITHFWYYILVTIILAILLRGKMYVSYKYNKTFKPLIFSTICYILLETVLLLWGCIEMAVISLTYTIDHNQSSAYYPFVNISGVNLTACNDIIDTNIWKYGVVSAMIQFMFGVGFGTLCICKAFKCFRC